MKLDKNTIKQIGKGVVIVIVLLFAYLFLLNGRYTFNGGYCFDKWRGKMIDIEWKD